MRRSLGFGALLAVLAGIIAVAPASPALAVTEPITVSSDGVIFGNDLPATLFGGTLIVPGGSVTRTIWVRNNTAEPGNLAVALRGVTGADPAMRAALKLRATSTPKSGPARPFSAANPCVSLVSGIPLAAGASLRVDLVLSLAGNLHGKQSQGSIGGFTIPLMLTSADVAAPDGCSAMPPSTPSDPPTGGGPTDPPGTVPPGTDPPGTIGTIDITGAAAGAVPLPGSEAGPLAGLGGKGAVRSFDTIPNTGRFWQEYDIVGYLLAIALGCLLAWRWRRKEIHEEVYA